MYALGCRLCITVMTDSYSLPYRRPAAGFLKTSRLIRLQAAVLLLQAVNVAAAPTTLHTNQQTVAVAMALPQRLRHSTRSSCQLACRARSQSLPFITTAPYGMW
jgi:hypothetical protein